MRITATAPATTKNSSLREIHIIHHVHVHVHTKVAGDFFLLTIKKCMPCRFCFTLNQCNSNTYVLYRCDRLPSLVSTSLLFECCMAATACIAIFKKVIPTTIKVVLLLQQQKQHVTIDADNHDHHELQKANECCE